tara:strand:- start:391 stop:792 length:402 start_codon:yes stop_codon:yes gene_type:complete
MKQFRNSRYWVGEDGEVFSYFPEWYKEYTTIGKNRKPMIVKNRRPEHYTPLKIQINSKNNRPYVALSLEKNNAKPIDVHRLVAELYIPGYFKGAHVDHIDCNIQNNHYTNLQWCTPEYNRKKGNNPNYPLFPL